MANLDVPHGFKPWGPVLRARYYAVPTAPTINISVGDAIQSDSGGIVSSKLGLGHSVEDAAIIPATPGDALKILGVVLGVFDENMDPLDNAPSGYIAPARVGDGTVAGYLLVADHPDQLFECQGDAAFTAADINLNYEIASATLAAPDTKTGLSTQEIDITGAAVTTTIPVRLHGQAYPDQDVYSAAGCRMICSFNPDVHIFSAPVML